MTWNLTNLQFFKRRNPGNMSLKKKKNGFKETYRYPIWDQVESWLLFLIYKSCPVACKHRDPTQSVPVIDCYFLKSRTDCVGGHTHTELKNQKPKTKNKQNITKQKKRQEKKKKKKSGYEKLAWQGFEPGPSELAKIENHWTTFETWIKELGIVGFHMTSG